jgi:hypothetical protein
MKLAECNVGDEGVEAGRQILSRLDIGRRVGHIDNLIRPDVGLGYVGL